MDTDHLIQSKGTPYKLMRQPHYIGDCPNQQAVPLEKRHLVQVRYQTAPTTREVAEARGTLLEK